MPPAVCRPTASTVAARPRARYSPITGPANPCSRKSSPLAASGPRRASRTPIQQALRGASSMPFRVLPKSLTLARSARLCGHARQHRRPARAPRSGRAAGQPAFSAMRAAASKQTDCRCRTRNARYFAFLFICLSARSPARIEAHIPRAFGRSSALLPRAPENPHPCPRAARRGRIGGRFRPHASRPR